MSNPTTRGDLLSEFHELPANTIVLGRRLRRSVHHLSCSTTPQNLVIRSRIQSMILRSDGTANILFGFTDSPNETMFLGANDPALIVPKEFFEGQPETVLYYSCVSGTGTLYLFLLMEES